MTVALENSRPTNRPKRSLIPWIFVGAMSVVVAVNAVMITVAVHSWTGLVVEKPYERGVAYNRVLEAQHHQDALGWRFTVAAQGTNSIRLTTARQDGKPLDGLELTAVLVRPIDMLPDVPLAFQQVGPGTYTAEVELPKLGQWDLKVDARRKGERFHLVERVIMK